MKAKEENYQIYFEVGSEDRVLKYRNELQKLGYATNIQILCGGCRRPLQNVSLGKYRYLCYRCGAVTKVRKNEQKVKQNSQSHSNLQLKSQPT